MPNLENFIAGAGVEKPILAQMATDAFVAPDTFVQPIIFPDTETPSFEFTAPKYNDDNLIAVEDDTVGRDTRFLSEDLSVSFYSDELGMHGRMAEIPALDLMRAQHAKEIAAARGNGNDPVFDLKALHTNSMYAKNQRHNEVLAVQQLVKTTNYDASHLILGAGDAGLNVRTSALVRETIAEAAEIVQDDGNGLPANAIVLSKSAERGLLGNTNFLDLLPETATKVVTKEDVQRIASLPDGGVVVMSSARAKRSKASPPFYVMDDWDDPDFGWIWIGRVVPATDRVNATFGRNYWTRDRRNNQRIYVKEMTLGPQETTVIVLVNYYRPVVTGKNFGVLIKTRKD